MSTWYQYRFGKLVTSVGGGIVGTVEHGCTGLSRELPDSVRRQCNPSTMLDDYAPSAEDLQTYPWHDEGVVMWRVVIGDASAPWLLATRQREISEAGAGGGKRTYTEAHYLAAPATCFSSGALLAVAQHLKAESVTERNYDLVPVRPGTTDLPLDAEWFEQIELYVAAVMSGVNVAIRDMTSMPAVYLRVFAVCLGAMPGTIAWRVPVGAGMMLMPESVALAHGTKPKAGLRVINGTARNEGDFDLRTGRAFVDWLRPRVSQCRTTEELVRSVRDAAPELSVFDAIDPSLGWREAAREAAGRIRERIELNELGRALDQGRSVGMLPGVKYLRSEFLEMLVTHATGADGIAALELLQSASGPEWREAWDALAASGSAESGARVRGIRLLVGAAPLEQPDALRSVYDVDPGEKALGALVARLVAAWDNTSHPGEWLRLVADRRSSPWLDAFIERADARLPWLVVRGIVDDARRLTALREVETNRFARGMLAALGDAPTTRNDGVIEEVLLAADERDRLAVDVVVSRLLTVAPLEGARALDTLNSRGIRPDAAVYLRKPWKFPTETRRFAEAIADAARRGELRQGVPAVLIPVLAFHWDAVDTAPQSSALFDDVARVLGTPLTEAACGRPAPHSVRVSGEPADVELFLELCNAQNDQPAERLASCAGQMVPEAGDIAVAMLRRWALATGRVAGPVTSSLLEHLGQLRVDGTRPIVARELRALTALLERWPVDVSTCATSEPVLFAFASAQPHRRTPHLSDIQAAILVSSVLEHSQLRSGWHALIDDRGWARESMWRWVRLCADGCNTSEEQMLFRLDPQVLVALLNHDLPVPALPALVRRVQSPEGLKQLAACPAVRQRDYPLLVPDIRALIRFIEFFGDSGNLGARETQHLASRVCEILVAQNATRNDVRAMLPTRGLRGKMRRGVKGVMRVASRVVNRAPKIEDALLASFEASGAVDADDFLRRYWLHHGDDEEA